MIQRRPFFPLHSKSSLTLQLTLFSHFPSTRVPPSHRRASTLLNIYSTPSPPLSANPFFITTRSYGVFFSPFSLSFVTGFHHSSVAFVCRGIQRCCSSTLLVLPLVSVCLFGCLFLYLYIRMCVCVCVCVCRLLSIISLSELSAGSHLYFHSDAITLKPSVSFPPLIPALFLSLFHPSTSSSISSLSCLFVFIQAHITTSLFISGQNNTDLICI